MWNKKQLTGIGALLCLAMAAALFGWSLWQRQTAAAGASWAMQYERSLHDKLQQAALAGEQLRVGATPAVDRYIYPFYFVNGVLQRWTTRDIAVPESELAAVDTTEAFRRLGDSWYVTNACEIDSVKIVTAVLIKRGYSYENEFLQPRVSPFATAVTVVDVAPATKATDGAAVVRSTSGAPLFTLIFDDESRSNRRLALRWIALVWLIAALALVPQYRNTNSVRMVVIGLLALLRYGIFAAKDLLYNSHFHLFAPSLYADSSFIPSLGSLLLHALFLFLMTVIAAPLFRQTTFCDDRKWTVARAVLLAAAGGCAWCIHYTWRSLILNSTIPLNLSQLDQLTPYTAAAYGILILLLATMFLPIHASVSGLSLSRRQKQAMLLCYIVAAASYALLSLEIYGHRTEALQARAWADKWHMEHDPTAEFYLNERVAPAIVADTGLDALIASAAPVDYVQFYIRQRYLQGYLRHYDLQLTICPYATQLHIDDEDGEEMDCRAFFEREIKLTGERLADDSPFYCLLNDNGRNSYLGVLHYVDRTGRDVDVFLELDSQLLSGGEGYPELLMEKSMANKIRMPTGYSFAKYAGGKLILHSGDFRYPHDNRFVDGVKVVADGYVHLLYHFDSHHTIVISRAAHTFWHWAILFSYLLLITAAGLAALLPAAGLRLWWPMLPNTFKRKIAVLFVAAFMVSILCTAVGSIWYSVHRFRESAMIQMEDKIRAVLTQLDYDLSHIRTIYDADKWALETTLRQLSNSLRIDVNVYDMEGRMVTSSRMEVFERRLQSTRLHRTAFDRLTGGQTTEFVNRERIGNLAFNAMYAAYYNRAGEPVAYVNIPYFSKRMQDIREISAVITTIINVYILALIAALLLGMALANRLLRPLEIVRRHMQQLDVTKKMDYIRYDEKDELGDLIRAYNQMIVALEESTRQLAQSERESAWREMARQIAHEIKNPLTPMQLSIQHLIRLKKERASGWPSRFDELAVALLEQIDTLAKTASEFSDFARITKAAPVEVRLDTLLHELCPLFDAYATIRFEWRNIDAPATVVAHPDLLSRVFLNLLTNAVQAVQDKPEGHIRITLAEFPDGYRVSIEDNGYGVSDSLRPQLFTLNFTTKTSGSGLGLAISKKILEHEGGHIAYSRSELGGACFVVELRKA
ncbi:MAG: HAMP domain-containing protein [Prevotellaceae bacterium]|jgi:signal transduction histidine kinase|nr:HAMP domain-containing protein [Prevotellaceae bacterium]